MTDVNKNPKEPRVSCRISPDLMRRIQTVAKANGIDVSAVVRISLNRELPRIENGQILVAPSE